MNHRVAYPGGEIFLRCPEGPPKDPRDWMIFGKNLPWKTVLKFIQRRRQLLVQVRRGAGTCDDLCI